MINSILYIFRASAKKLIKIRCPLIIRCTKLRQRIIKGQQLARMGIIAFYLQIKQYDYIIFLSDYLSKVEFTGRRWYVLQILHRHR